MYLPESFLYSGHHGNMYWSQVRPVNGVSKELVPFQPTMTASNALLLHVTEGA